MAEEAWIEARRDGAAGLALAAGGRWLVSSAGIIDRRLGALDQAAEIPGGLRKVRIDCAQIAALDTVGAWLVLRLKAALGQKGADVSIENLAPRFSPLLHQAERYVAAVPAHVPSRAKFGLGEAFAWLGELSLYAARELSSGLSFFGMVTLTVLRLFWRPGHFRFVAFISHMQRTGVSALPIVGLLSFLIGVVVAYQGAEQLRYFGAEIFTVNLLGVGFLRELGVLMTAIIVAGRSGSAFTAEIGTMRVNEEVDAMTTLGLDPIEVLVIPRLAALIVTLPLLTFYANIMGLVGGAFICNAALGIPLPLFLQQLHGAIVGWHFWLGLIKAPFFAICIALVGCREGLRVQRNAESVGRLTTLSVVESIFLVIVIDAAFSVLFSQLDI